MLGDQLFFFLGRYHGASFLDHHPSWQKRVEKVDDNLQPHRFLIILGFRFLYGLRTVTPFVIGLSRIPILEFMILNIIGAAMWSIVIGGFGYAFGHGLKLLLGDIRRYEIEILALALFAGVLVWLVHIVRTRN